jgi:hypothetical protein
LVGDGDCCWWMQWCSSSCASPRGGSIGFGRRCSGARRAGASPWGEHRLWLATVQLVVDVVVLVELVLLLGESIGVD